MLHLTFKKFSIKHQAQLLTFKTKLVKVNCPLASHVSI